MDLFSYGNAKRFFVTASHTDTVMNVVSHALAQKCDPSVVLESGGVWRGKYRVQNPQEKICKGETLRVYVAASQGYHYSLNSDDIFYEHDDWVVIHKPPGVSSVSDRSNLFFNMTAGVNQWLKMNGNHYKTNPITRLDFMVNGLMIFPKSRDAEVSLSRLMTQRQIKKGYLTLLPDQDSRSIIRIKDRLGFKSKAFIDNRYGKDAHSIFIKGAVESGICPYFVSIQTGRRHQIRIHSSHYLLPIIGDQRYGSSIKLPNQQLALMAYAYNFSYQGNRFKIRSDRYQSWISSLIGSIDELNTL